MDVAIRRVYEPPSPQDGVRVLVDRLWPRGLSRDGARIDVWMKSLSPSNELRRWYGHDPALWEEFKRRYRAELATAGEAVEELRHMARKGRVTLLFASREPDFNNAAALKFFLSEENGAPARG